MDQETYEFLQNLVNDDSLHWTTIRFMLSCILRHRTDSQLIFYMYGAANSGKSTLAKWLEYVLGPERCATTTLAKLRSRFGTFQIVNKTLVIIPDVINRFTDDFESFLKNVSRGEIITVEQKFVNAIGYRPNCNILIHGNHDIIFKDPGLQRSVIKIPCFSTPKEGKPHMLDTLINNSPEIIRWAFGCPISHIDYRTVVGLKEILNNEVEDDPVLQWCTTVLFRCHPDQGEPLGLKAENNRSTLYGNYSFWCEQNDFFPLFPSKFPHRLLHTLSSLNAPVLKRRRSGGIYLLGVSFTGNPSDKIRLVRSEPLKRFTEEISDPAKSSTDAPILF
uniref:SF3 helicase domain-containing protein n=1 Tax=Glaucocystis incrassata TaxID=1789788 RepID=A0A3G1IVE3_9EUKA|nr:hypothetical protein [Glaucocystis incrassata]ASQ40018.1 hypothetical protein [Glaucocystis incrassata]